MTKASARDGRARCQLIFLPPSCHSERSRGISNSFLMSRDYNFWVYIVTNVHDSVLYIGITNDLARRVSEHRSGEVPGFTSAYRCRKLIYYEHSTDVQDAIAREKQLKKWSRQKKVALIATLSPDWKDLAPEVLGEEQEMSRLRST